MDNTKLGSTIFVGCLFLFGGLACAKAGTNQLVNAASEIIDRVKK